ncbi:MAG: DUF1697 domain-containing protein [Burkholderiales bacterium]|nr:DUF1697 domain-containing protein [Flavobacterium sp.]
MKINTYIALLRGINVSGHKIIKMELLQKALQELDVKNISTYIQSGNILFQSEVADKGKLAHQISGVIVKHFGFDVPVMVFSPEELKKVVADNPYAHQKIQDAAQPYVAFLSEPPHLPLLEMLQSVPSGKDTFVLVEKVLYLFYADSAGNTKLSNAVIENKLKLKSTMRNWKTVKKLIELADQLTTIR